MKKLIILIFSVFLGGGAFMLFSSKNVVKVMCVEGYEILDIKIEKGDSKIEEVADNVYLIKKKWYVDTVLHIEYSSEKSEREFTTITVPSRLIGNPIVFVDEEVYINYRSF